MAWEAASTTVVALAIVLALLATLQRGCGDRGSTLPAAAAADRLTRV